MPAETKIEIDAKLLRRLHHGHTQLAHDLETQVNRAPIQLKASGARLQKCEAAVEEVQIALKKTKIISDQKQLQLSEREAHITEIEGKLNLAASNREFSTFQEQIAADKKANEVLSDEIFETLERIDQVSDQLAQAETTHATETQEHDQRVKAIEERHAVATENLQMARSSLATAEKEIPEAMRTDYNRIIKRKGEEALAPVEDDSCGGCHQTLTTQFIDRLRMSKLVRCPNCDAFLYQN